MQLYRMQLVLYMTSSGAWRTSLMQTDERITQDASVINAPFSLKKSGD